MSKVADALLDGIAGVINSAQGWSDMDAIHLLRGYASAVDSVWIADGITMAQRDELREMLWEMKFGWEPTLIEAKDAA